MRCGSLEVSGVRLAVSSRTKQGSTHMDIDPHDDVDGYQRSDEIIPLYVVEDSLDVVGFWELRHSIPLPHRPMTRWKLKAACMWRAATALRIEHLSHHSHMDVHSTSVVVTFLDEKTGKEHQRHLHAIGVLKAPAVRTGGLLRMRRDGAA